MYPWSTHPSTCRCAAAYQEEGVTASSAYGASVEVDSERVAFGRSVRKPFLVSRVLSDFSARVGR